MTKSTLLSLTWEVQAAKVSTSSVRAGFQFEWFPSLMSSLLLDGFAFLQRFYSVFDTGNAQVGLATTAFTDATTN